MTGLFDTHCHIQSAGTNQKADIGTKQMWAKTGDVSVDELIADAHKAGVSKLLVVGCDLEDSQLAISCVRTRKDTWASIGIHPHEAQHNSGKINRLERFAELAIADKVVAIGECGLDYFYEHSPREAQQELLKFQIELALKHNLPMVFHVRQAFDDFWPIFESYPGIRGVLHSFTDSIENLERAISHGLYIGVNGIATFTKDAEQIEMYKSIPLDKLVVETDAPFLTPHPYRGTICMPKHVRVTAEFLSALRGESLERFSAATTKNAQELLGL